MRELLTRSRRWLKVGWFWPLVLLALPNCFLDASGLGPLPALEPGSNPTSAIMCDIPKFTEVTPNCAQPGDDQFGISFAHAAVALANGETSSFALDFSQPGACSGQPVKTEFFGSFPEGFAVCLNCGSQIPDPHADATAVCVAQCKDLFNFGEGPAPSNVTQFCLDHAKVSTNFNKSTCFDEACENGTLKSDFADPRRIPEPVIWHDLIGTAAPGNQLMRTAPTTGNDDVDYNAGAASKQVIGKGDGWVEFEAAENDLGHVVGLSESCDGCTDDDPSIFDVQFGISLNLDGRVYVIESGVFVLGPDVNNSFGTYAAGERFRVVVTDNNDGTATVSYFRVTGSCSPGTPCPTAFLVSHIGPASYPFRVDASFRQQNATVANATLVRIQ